MKSMFLGVRELRSLVVKEVRRDIPVLSVS
jgi:hypothetical protein